MKAEDLKTKTVDELETLLLDARKGQFNMRFQKTQGSLEKTSEIRKNRRDIARIKTFIAQTTSEAAQEVKKDTKKAEPVTKKPVVEAEKKTKAKKADSQKPAKKKA